MKYISRSIRYFIFITLLLALILVILILTKVIEGNIETMFRNGYDSLWQIAAMFFVLSFAYPKLGYTKKGARIPGEYSVIKKQIVDFMKERGYELVNEENENLVFRLSSTLSRILRKSDSTITMTRELPGFYVEGAVKDVMRLVSALESKFNHSEE